MAGMKMRTSERQAFENRGFERNPTVPTGYRVVAINHDGTVEFYRGNSFRQISEDSRNYLKNTDTELYSD